MNNERTLAIIKPRAVKARHTGPIIAQIEQAGFAINALTKVQLTLGEARAFYAVHAARPFYENLCTYMVESPVLVMVLEKSQAIEDFRALIGTTNPADAAAGTLRRQFGTSIDDNAIHGSDAPATAAQEIAFFFGRKCCCEGKC